MKGIRFLGGGYGSIRCSQRYGGDMESVWAVGGDCRGTMSIRAMAFGHGGMRGIGTIGGGMRSVGAVGGHIRQLFVQEILYLLFFLFFT